MKFLTIVGTRPEIIRLCGWQKDILFTAQQTDPHMVGDLKFPDKNFYLLENRSLFERVKELNPEIIIVDGDTNTALYASRVAKSLGIKLAHIEAGVRATDDTIENRNRREIDKLADYNFCPIPQAVDNLLKEGITNGIFVGDILYDFFLKTRDYSDFVLVTIHRNENIENRERLTKLIDSLKDYKLVIFPIHPHTKDCLNRFDINLPNNVIETPPLSHQEIIKYIRDAKMVLTDSGGVQREAYWLGTPCKVARPDTEWDDAIGQFGDGHAGDKILQILSRI